MPNGSSQTGDGGASGNGRKAEGWEGNLLPTFVVNPLSGCLACRFFFLSGGEFLPLDKNEGSVKDKIS
jgi:hypothetical protein